MIIQINFNENFRHQNVDNQSFTVDIDPKESISNLKTLISLKFTDLDPEFFELDFNRKPLKDEQTCIDLKQLAHSEQISLTLRKSNHACCTIF